MSLFVLIPAASMARTMLSRVARPALSSPMPGAARRVPSRLTLTSVPSGKTVSRWAETTTSGPPPVPLRTPMALPSWSISTSVRPWALSISM